MRDALQRSTTLHLDEPTPAGRGARPDTDLQCSRAQADGRTMATFRTLGAVLALALVPLGCADGGGAEKSAITGPKTCDGSSTSPQRLTVWYHGGKTEAPVVRDQVRRFNAAQRDIAVSLRIIPEATYVEVVAAARHSGELPDVLDVDGPVVPSYAASKSLRPLEDCMPAALRADLLPSILAAGSFGNHTWGVGTFDSGLALYASRRALVRARVRIPTGIEDAWSVDEFDRVLPALRRTGYRRPLDLKLNYGSPEWFTYGFSPILQSAGADLVRRIEPQLAHGVLDGEPAVQAMDHVRTWFRKGYVTTDPQDDAFVKGRTPLSWVGHWEYPRYKKALGDDLVLVPLPDFGQGPRTGMGSWQWTITKTAKDPDAAWRFIAWLLRPAEIRRITDANGAVPASKAVVETSRLYRAGGDLELYAQQLLGGAAVPRPQSADYPGITVAFRDAFQAISRGGDTASALERAARAIDAAQSR
jgi:multiple sugar transport system substrate-binding protein